MLKRSGLLILVFSLLISSSAFAASIEEEGTAVRKLQRGFTNVVLSPIELTEAISEATNGDVDWYFGLFKGIFLTAGRVVTGVYDVLTFPLEMPANYGPVFEPEFVWEHLED